MIVVCKLHFARVTVDLVAPASGEVPIERGVLLDVDEVHCA